MYGDIDVIREVNVKGELLIVVRPVMARDHRTKNEVRIEKVIVGHNPAGGKAPPYVFLVVHVERTDALVPEHVNMQFMLEDAVALRDALDLVIGNVQKEQIVEKLELQ